MAVARAHDEVDRRHLDDRDAGHRVQRRPFGDSAEQQAHRAEHGIESIPVTPPPRRRLGRMRVCRGNPDEPPTAAPCSIGRTGFAHDSPREAR